MSQDSFYDEQTRLGTQKAIRSLLDASKTYARNYSKMSTDDREAKNHLIQSIESLSKAVELLTNQMK